MTAPQTYSSQSRLKSLLSSQSYDFLTYLPLRLYEKDLLILSDLANWTPSEGFKKLMLTSIAKAHDLSQEAVRQSLNRLISSGLVVRYSRKHGYEVVRKGPYHCPKTHYHLNPAFPKPFLKALFRYLYGRHFSMRACVRGGPSRYTPNYKLTMSVRAFIKTYCPDGFFRPVCDRCGSGLAEEEVASLSRFCGPCRRILSRKFEVQLMRCGPCKRWFINYRRWSRLYCPICKAPLEEVV